MAVLSAEKVVLTLSHSGSSRASFSISTACDLRLLSSWLGNEKRVAVGCSLVSTRTSESSRASAREASDRESSVSRLACCWR